jgi:hypothetical protein
LEAVLVPARSGSPLATRDPLFPFSIFRVKGLAASDAVQMIAFAAFVSVSYFLTLYMQNVVGYSPIRSGSAYLPLTASFHRALLACAIFLLAAAVIALRAANSRGEPATEPSGTPASREQVPAPELAD